MSVGQDADPEPMDGRGGRGTDGIGVRRPNTSGKNPERFLNESPKKIVRRVQKITRLN